MTEPIARHRTALHRQMLSRPAAAAVEDGLIAPGSTVLDYGCGRGTDVRLLVARGIEAHGWDPVFAPEGSRDPADVVTLTYVVNVIEDPKERGDALRAAWELAQHTLVVSARLARDGRRLEGVDWLDGVLTSRRTFQKLFTQDELRAWIVAELGHNAIATAPGVFYVFRDDARAQAFIASRFRQRMVAPRVRISDILYDRFRTEFDALAAFVADRGRVPRAEELPAAAALAREVGSIPRAFAILKRFTGGNFWDEIVRARLQDLLVYIALSRFGGRPKATQLPSDVRYDIHDFFGRYAAACRVGDELLQTAGRVAAIDEACRSSSIGKLTPNALYIHTSAIGKLDPLLRVYEGCGRVLAGTVAGANIVKLHRGKAQVSYLAYPDFDRSAHPTLAFVAKVRLGRLETDFADYRAHVNPPILHRKELFVGPGYSGRDRFERLTRAEERAGLYDTTAAIGNREQWNQLLSERGYVVKGHRLMRVRTWSAEH